MRVIGFNFTKVSGERLKDTAENLSISTSLDVPEISEIKPNFLNNKDQLIEAKFTYKVDYEPSVAKIALEGKILLSVEEKIAEEVLSQWKKKKIPEDFRIPLLNVVMKKSALKALTICDELNLPVHIPMPALRKEQKEQK